MQLNLHLRFGSCRFVAVLGFWNNRMGLVRAECEEFGQQCRL